MLFNQIKQVGVTYLTQRYLWWGLLLLGFMVVPQLMLANRPNRTPTDAAQPMMMILGMPMLFALPFLVGQVKVQLAHWRARLTPNFLPAHLIVLCGILLTIFLFYPLFLAAMCGLNPLGFIALAVAIGVPAILGAHFSRFIPFLISLVVFYSLFTDWGLRWWIVDASEHRLEHGLIVLCGVTTLAAWVWRVTCLSEESDDYQNIYQAMLARRTGVEAVEQRRIIATQLGRNRFQAWIGDQWHNHLGGYCGDNQAGRVRLLRYGFATVPVEVQGLFMVAMIICLGVFLGRFSYLAKPGANFGAMIVFIQFAVVLPGQMASELLAQRRPRMAMEMLLPMTRAQLVDALLTVATRNAFVSWLMMNAAIGIVFTIVSDELVIQTALMFVLLSATTMLAAVGLGLRLAVWPSRAKRYAVLLPCWIPLIMPLIIWASSPERIGDWPFVVMAAILATLGVGLMVEARRAWLNLELG